MSDYSDPMEGPSAPPNERWWERELLRNQKLMDKYMEVLGDNPDWDKWRHPEDLYNKVHFGIDPPEHIAEEEEEQEEVSEDIFGSSFEFEEEDDSFMETSDDFEIDAAMEDEEFAQTEGYGDVARLARDFAVELFEIKDLPHDSEIIYLSAGKIGGNLAGGHGLGYEEENICGNIVKCRWALGDAEFCREMLEHLYQRTGRPEFEKLSEDARGVSGAIRERIERLRARVWW
jgi:hypothetical protein